MDYYWQKQRLGFLKQQLTSVLQQAGLTEGNSATDRYSASVASRQ